MNWKKSEYKNVLMEDNGLFLGPEACKRQFIQWLSEGKKKIPFCDLKECPDFHYEKGCPEHPIKEEE